MARTLLVTRAENNHTYYRKQLEGVGFKNVTVTSLDRDALNMFIRDLNPNLLMMGARFYECSTPYMMGELKKQFPDINMAALSLEAYPPDLAMYFILNGIRSYDTAFDGFDKFFDGLRAINFGKKYISQSVQERMKLRIMPMKPAGKISMRHYDVLRLVCCGLNNTEIAETLYITRKTVYSHIREIYRSLNVRKPVELVRTALKQKIITEDELFFFRGSIR
jgi:DNA-binding NarL/FixJ family response regulator